MTTADHEKALVLVAEIAEALANGTRHYNDEGRLLPTVRDVVETLLEEGAVRLEFVAPEA